MAALSHSRGAGRHFHIECGHGAARQEHAQFGRTHYDAATFEGNFMRCIGKRGAIESKGYRVQMESAGLTVEGSSQIRLTVAAIASAAAVGAVVTQVAPEPRRRARGGEGRGWGRGAGYGGALLNRLPRPSAGYLRRGRAPQTDSGPCFRAQANTRATGVLAQAQAAGDMELHVTVMSAAVAFTATDEVTIAGQAAVSRSPPPGQMTVAPQNDRPALPGCQVMPSRLVHRPDDGPGGSGLRRLCKWLRGGLSPVVAIWVGGIAVLLAGAMGLGQQLRWWAKVEEVLLPHWHQMGLFDRLEQRISEWGALHAVDWSALPTGRPDDPSDDVFEAQPINRDWWRKFDSLNSELQAEFTEAVGHTSMWWAGPLMHCMLCSAVLVLIRVAVAYALEELAETEGDDKSPDGVKRRLWRDRAVTVFDFTGCMSLLATLFQGLVYFQFVRRATNVCHSIRRLHDSHNTAMSIWSSRYYLVPTPQLPEYSCALPVIELNGLVQGGIVFFVIQVPPPRRRSLIQPPVVDEVHWQLPTKPLTVLPATNLQALWSLHKNTYYYYGMLHRAWTAREGVRQDKAKWERRSFTELVNFSLNILDGQGYFFFRTLFELPLEELLHKGAAGAPLLARPPAPATAPSNLAALDHSPGECQRALLLTVVRLSVSPRAADAAVGDPANG